MNYLHLVRLAALTSEAFLRDARSPATRTVTRRFVRRRGDQRAAARIRCVERRTRER